MQLTLPRRVGAALAAAGLAFGVLAGVTGLGHIATRSALADTAADAGLITGVTIPKLVGDSAAAVPPAEVATHDHGPLNLQTK
jgi:hypothetical protein